MASKIKTYRGRLATELAEATVDGRGGRAGPELGPVGSAPLLDGAGGVDNRLGGGDGAGGGGGDGEVGGAEGEAARWSPVDVNDQPGCIDLVIYRCLVSGHLARKRHLSFQIDGVWNFK